MVFYAAIRDDGSIDLNFVADLTWWLGVRCTYVHATGDAKLVGELLYICINTVPEIMYALSALTRT